MTDLRTHRRRYLILLLLLCPVAAFVVIPHPPDMSVDNRARQLVPIKDPYPSRLAGMLAYQWQSPGQIVVMHHEGRVGLVDIASGAESPPEKVDALLRGRAAVSQLAEKMPSWVVSPDGKWLLTFTLAHKGLEWVVVAIDGSRLIEIPTVSHVDPMAFWDRDSRGFYQTQSFREGKTFLRWFPLDGPWPPSTTAIGDDPRDLSIKTPPYEFDNPFTTLGEFAEDYLLIVDFGGRGPQPCLIYNLKSRSAPQPHEIDVPKGAFADELELSPDGKRLGWIFDFAISSGDPDLRRLPFVPITPGHGNNEVWVSSLDGSHMHPVVTPDWIDNKPGPNNLRWTLDSKYVTFVYGGYLYAAPAG